MSYERESIYTTHNTENNRLTKRLFQLEARVTELELQVEDIAEIVEFLIEMNSFEPEDEIGVRFCTCDEDDTPY